jgi:hypothetical protein
VFLVECFAGLFKKTTKETKYFLIALAQTRKMLA